jgi:hypothetical protein
MKCHFVAGLAVCAAIIVACPARAEDAICRRIDNLAHPATPDLSANPVLALGRVTSAANRVQFVKDAEVQPGCPSRAPACAETAYLTPGDRVIISARRDAFVCATYINAKGGARPGWLPADAVADDKAEPVALSDWLGHWHHSDVYGNNVRLEGDITVKAGKAGALRIEGTSSEWFKGAASAIPAAIKKSDVTPAGDRLSFTSDGCKMWMQRLGPWLIVSDDEQCGGGGDGQNATFDGVYTRQP